MELGRERGNIFDIQGFSVHDGPGCRTLIFMNGCTLRCAWCSNPEGFHVSSALMYHEDLCIRCGNCVASCNFNAVTLTDHQITLDRHYCQECPDHPCTTTCYSGALKLSGKKYSVEEVFAIVQRDREYWGQSGGITLGGGEPLLQIDFAEALLSRFYDAYIHTAIETCGNVSWENFERVLPYLDWIFFDLKHPEIQMHHQFTGFGNQQILHNAVQLAKNFFGRIIFRMPLIPGFNDAETYIRQTAEFLNSINRKEIHVLPLHHLGRQKYEYLGIEYPAKDIQVPSPEKLNSVKQLFTDLGIRCYLGYDTGF